MLFLLVPHLLAADPMDIQGMLLGASKDLPWGSPVPLVLVPKCETRSPGLQVCLASDEAINVNTRGQTQFGYCNGKLVSVTGFFYGKGASESAAMMLGMIQSQLGPPERSGQDATWARGDVRLSIGPGPMPQGWSMIAANLAGMRDCG